MTEEERASICAISEIVKRREAGELGLEEAIRQIGEIVAKDDARRAQTR